MPFVFSQVEYCDMHFVYEFCESNPRAAVDEYQRRFPERRIPPRGVFSRIHQTMRENGCLSSVAVQSEMEMVRTINTRENILQMVQRSPRLSTSRIASRIVYHVHRCGELCMRKIYILIMIKGYIWNQATMLNVWICATGQKHIPKC